MTDAQFTKLDKIQSEEIQAPNGVMNLVSAADIKISAQSQPLSGVAKLMGKTKSGNFKYILTCGTDQHAPFYSKEELKSNRIDKHSFGIQLLTDDKSGEEKELYWF